MLPGRLCALRIPVSLIVNPVAGESWPVAAQIARSVTMDPRQPAHDQRRVSWAPEVRPAWVLAGWSRVIRVVRELPGHQGEEGLESGSVGVGGIELDSGGKQS